MKYEIIFSAKAILTIRNIALYIGSFNPDRAMSFSKELYEKANSLCEFPYRCQTYKNARRLVHGNYIIVYRVNEAKKRVTILYVTEGHRAY
jgi:plasmid stabilization system protein ParE